MQPSTTLRIILCLFLATLLSGCAKPANSNVGELEKQFLTIVPVTDMNKSLQIVMDSKEGRLKNSSKIGLTLYNKSSHSISFDNYSSVKLLGSTDNLHWFTVKNDLTYSDTMSLSPQGTPLLDVYYTWVKPSLEATNLNTENKDVLLRIVVVGEIIENNKQTGQQAGAYVDMALQP